jgi:hypothetical protein
MDGVDKMAEMWLGNRREYTISVINSWVKAIVWGDDPCEM